MANSDTFLALADFLIPAYEKKPSFGVFCSYDDAIRALGFRPDLREAFERALAVDMKDGPERALVAEVAWVEIAKKGDLL